MTTLVLLPGLDGTDILFQPFVKALPDWIRTGVHDESALDSNAVKA